jgi:hypothetical protein
MQKPVVRCLAVVAATFLLIASLSGRHVSADTAHVGSFVSPNASGLLETLDVNGPIDLGNPFFADLGANGRRCVTCHIPWEGWSITPAGVRLRFALTRGLDPLFRNNDGSNCEGTSPRTPPERQAAYSLLLDRGLIRVGLDVPAGADFTIDHVSDPFGCAPGSNAVSAYRRPLPSTNLRFVSAVMWDGRESSAATTIREDLLHQANDATRGHAAALADLSPRQAQQIVDFELGLSTAQIRDARAGSLRATGAAGGPARLVEQPFFLGINDPVGLNPSNTPFDPAVFTLFDAWTSLRPSRDATIEARRAIARGQRLFNSKSFTLSGVAGLNGQMFASGVTPPDSFQGTCTICHDTPNAGSHSVKAPLNIGLSDPEVAPYLPVYTLRNLQSGETVRTTDPGRALISGRWDDVGKFKGPVLRALASRAPYFHNGSARTLEEAVTFYDTRFAIGFTAREKADLAAFLRSL